MKKITKIVAIFMFTLALFSVFAVSAFAEGDFVDADANGAVSEGITPSENKNVTEGEKTASESVSFWDRISEFLTGDRVSQGVTFAYNIFCTVLLIMMKKSTTTSALDLVKIVSASDKSNKEKMNELADVYNENEKEVEALKSEIRKFREEYVDKADSAAKISESLREEIAKLKEEHATKTVTAEQFNAALEGIRDIGIVLQTIYQGSSTVPAVIKTTVIKKIAELNDIIDKAERRSHEEVTEHEQQN